RTYAHLPTFPTRRSSDLISGGTRPRRSSDDSTRPWPAASPTTAGHLSRSGHKSGSAATCSDVRGQHHRESSLLRRGFLRTLVVGDRKSTRLNSSHRTISY